MRSRLAFALLALSATAGGAQPAPSRVGPDSVTLAPGLRYQAGGFHRFLLGHTYRDLWATPITVPVLDLRRYAGGLRPQKRGGGNQTKSLRFTTPDGSEYVFRLVDKDKVTVPSGFEHTIVEGMARDQVSASHPAAAIVSGPLLDAAGVLHVTPVLAAMPDDSLLGEFREDFAGKLGMIERYPNKPDSAPGFAGAAEIIDSDKLIDQLNKDASRRIDARAFLRARLMDMFLNDWDRHTGQWKWARFDTGQTAFWEPIPRDRDKPFISFGGIVRASGRFSPNVVTFAAEYPSIRGLTWNSLEIDRRVLAELEKPVWDSVAEDLKRRLSDPVIERATRIMPAEFRDQAPGLAAVLKARRDQIPELATRFYLFLAPVQDLHATDAADHALVTRRDDGSVDVALRSGSRDYFARSFRPGETREIRLYLHGGADTALVTGRAERSIPVWIIGGNGDNVLVDSSSVHGTSGPARLYDRGEVSGIEYGPDTAWNRRPWSGRPGRMTAPPRDRSSSYTPGLALHADHDIGVLVHLALDQRAFGFRKNPYASRIELSEDYATKFQGHRATALVDLRREASPLHFMAQARMSEIEVVNFPGFGNDTPDDESDFYQVRQRQWQLHSALGLAVGPRSDISFGPVLQFSTTDSLPGRFISAARPYGFGDFGQAGLRLSLSYDGRDRSSDPRRGVLFSASGSWYPALWDVKDGFGVVEGTATTYLVFPVPAHPKLTLRAGARKAFGQFPFHEAAFIGGRTSIRTLDPDRYAGDAALNGRAQLQLSLARFAFILPLNVGAYGFTEGGRVYLEGESPGGWHTATGVGVWLGILGPSTGVGLELAERRGKTGLRFQTGMIF
ncbi:MAG TPA: BamA/TamA family outer membrane protein [Gemmatimonadales bacterium]|nr:BamA/TamA family outer membrane protein [Gemmatimonadales bacterium]